MIEIFVGTMYLKIHSTHKVFNFVGIANLTSETTIVVSEVKLAVPIYPQWYTYSIVIFDVNSSSLVNKVPHYVYIASFSYHVQRSPLIERRTYLLTKTYM